MAEASRAEYHCLFLLQASCVVLEMFSHNRYSCLQLAEDAANTFSPGLYHKEMFFSIFSSLCLV